MKKQQTPRYMACTTLNGYAVRDLKKAVNLYCAAFYPNHNTNIDTEVAMSKIADILNVTESPAADQRILESINLQLKQFDKYKTV